MKFYARPSGNHIHSELDCDMLEGEQFKHYKYKEVALDEAQRRNLKVCPCVHRTFKSHHRLTVANVRRLAKTHG